MLIYLRLLILFSGILTENLANLDQNIFPIKFRITFDC